VQKTLIEAFVLVVIVVYLFLGSVRPTLIPTFAVPVSLIGTFVALLAVGYSANSVSLLAVVLAIGIFGEPWSTRQMMGALRRNTEGHHRPVRLRSCRCLISTSIRSVARP
jgi:Cu/Ag efflux pump CusA